jgi:hypothetical protein
MTKRFHEGQNVEVATCLAMDLAKTIWRKAKIVGSVPELGDYEVEFPDGTGAVFEAEHIRAAERWLKGAFGCVDCNGD